MNRAIIRSYVLKREPVPSREDVRAESRKAFAVDPDDDRVDDTNCPLVTVWERNDFGKWAFNLRRNGRATPYYIHTTPEDERATAEGRAFALAQSHGCIHIRPNDRDTMMAAGYLAAGVPLEVKEYEAQGPP